MRKEIPDRIKELIKAIDVSLNDIGEYVEEAEEIGKYPQGLPYTIIILSFGKEGLGHWYDKRNILE